MSSPAHPLTLRVSSPYGLRVHPVTGERRHHNGVDLAIPQGTPIRPIGAGRVAKVWDDHPINGTAVRIDHGGGWSSSYVHLSRRLVGVGDVVAPGAPLGLSGGAPGTYGAGRSTGPHLHLIVAYQGRDVDPVPLISWAPYTLT